MRKQDACFNERFLKPLKRKHDSLTSSRFSNKVLEGPQSRVYKIDDNDYAIEEKEEYFDPQYTRFLKMLHVHGKSYALEVSRSDGEPAYLKYNMDGESDDEDSRQSTRRKMGNGKEGEKTVEIKETKNKVGRPRKLRSLLMTDRRVLVNDEDSRPSTRGQMSNGKEGEKTVEGKEAKNKVGRPRKLWSLPRTDWRDLVDVEDSKLPTGQKSNGKKAEKIQASKETKNKAGNPSKLRSIQGKERRDLVDGEDCRPPIRGKMSNGNKGENMQARKGTKVEVGNRRILRSLLGNESRYPVGHGADDLGMDGAYQLFLNGISKQGNVCVWKCPSGRSGRQVVYEDDDVGGSDSEIEVWDIVPNGSDGNPTPFVSEKGCPASILGVRGHSSAEMRNSEFRKKVVDILRRPYNHDEYVQLLRDIEVEKPVGHIKDLRSRPISFSVGATKSYLSHHIDVEMEISAVKHDRRQVLNILRGFFFWLEHIADDKGVFKPWLDASCRMILPASP